MSEPRARALLLGCASWLAWVGCARPPQSSPDKPVPVAKDSASEARPALDPNTRGFELGERYRYVLTSSTTVRFGESAASFDFDLIGQVDLIPASVTPTDATVYLAFADASVVNRLPARRAELDALVSELRSSGAFFTLSGGLTSEFRVASGMSQMAAAIYRQIGAALQFARAGATTTRRYTAEEFDTTGRYLAEYERAGDESAWLKRKQRYLGLLGTTARADAGKLSILPRVTGSHGEVRLAPSGRPISVKMLDELVVSGTQTPVRSKLRIDLESVPAPLASAPPKFSELLARTRRFGAEEPDSDVQEEGALDRARIGGLDFASVVARLETLASQRNSRAVDDDPVPSDPDPAAERARVHEDARLFHALAAIFRTQPAAIDAAVAKVRANSPASDALMDALGSASTPRAHRALASLLSSPRIDPEVRGRLVFALARVKRPTEEATLALKSVLRAEPFHAGALYGLGTHARLLRDSGKSAEAAALGEFLVQRLARAAGPMSVSTVLKAIANSGYAAALPRVRTHLESQEERVRAAAVYALQSMRDARVDVMITSRLRNDESMQVRKAAIEVAELRDPSDELTRALAHAAANDRDPHVRHRAVELIASWLPRRSELRATLEHVAVRDGEARIRERARAAL